MLLHSVAVGIALVWALWLTTVPQRAGMQPPGTTKYFVASILSLLVPNAPGRTALAL